MNDSTTPPRFPTIRVNLLRAHGSPTGYLYQGKNGGCRCACCAGAHRDGHLAYGATHKEEMDEYRRAYNQKHRERIAEYARRYRREHPQETAESNRLFFAKNPEKKAEYVHRRRARKLAAPGRHTAADLRAQYKRQSGKCFWRDVMPDCAVSLEGGYHVDHVMPLSRSGSNGPENIVIACPGCNHSKYNKHPMDFAGVLC